jgi:hypothetical protein
MDTKTALEAEPQIDHIDIPPDGGEAYNRIEIKLGIKDDVLFLESVTPGDEPAVQLDGSIDAPALDLKVYCPRTKFFISLPEGSGFESADPQADVFQPESAASNYTAAIEEGVLSISAANFYRVSDPLSETQEAATASLKAIDSSGRSIAITLCAPPYRLVEIEFDVDAKPEVAYGSGSDFSSEDGEIRMPQDGGIVFTLVSRQEGARFADSPFDPPPPADWIIDVGTDGEHAFLADLHPGAGSSYDFRVRVSYGGQDWESEDPTIVNVDPSPPTQLPESGRGALVSSEEA